MLYESVFIGNPVFNDFLCVLKTHEVPIYATEKIFSEVKNKLEAFESSSKVMPQLQYGVLA